MILPFPESRGKSHPGPQPHNSAVFGDLETQLRYARIPRAALCRRTRAERQAALFDEFAELFRPVVEALVAEFVGETVAELTGGAQ